MSNRELKTWLNSPSVSSDQENPMWVCETIPHAKLVGDKISHLKAIQIEFHYLSAMGSEFTECNFNECGFVSGELVDVLFRGCVFKECAFVKCHFTNVRFENCHFYNSHLEVNTLQGEGCSLVVDRSVLYDSYVGSSENIKSIIKIYNSIGVGDVGQIEGFNAEKSNQVLISLKMQTAPIGVEKNPSPFKKPIDEIKEGPSKKSTLVAPKPEKKGESTRFSEIEF